MKDALMPLNRLPLGSRARVVELSPGGNSRRRIQDLGLVSGTEVLALQKSPSGDPTAYQFRGTVVALRSEEAGRVLVQALRREE